MKRIPEYTPALWISSVDKQKQTSRPCSWSQNGGGNSLWLFCVLLEREPRILQQLVGSGPVWENKAFSLSKQAHRRDSAAIVCVQGPVSTQLKRTHTHNTHTRKHTRTYNPNRAINIVQDASRGSPHRLQVSRLLPGPRQTQASTECQGTLLELHSQNQVKPFTALSLPPSAEDQGALMRTISTFEGKTVIKT